MMKQQQQQNHRRTPMMRVPHTTTTFGLRGHTSCSVSQPSTGFSIFQWYTNCLEHRPIITKSITSAIIAGTGDGLCQSLQTKDDDGGTGWDKWRTARFASLGLVMCGPGCHFWYGALVRWFPGTSMVRVSQRVIIDQLVFNPPFLVVWLTAFWYMEDASQLANSQDYMERMKEHFPNIMVANWTLWFPVQAFTFRFIPLSFQVLATNCFDLLWNTYLSFTTSEMNGTDDAATAAADASMVFVVSDK